VHPEVRLWSVNGSKLTELPKKSFAEAHKEQDLERWVEQNPSLLGRDLSIIGRQIHVPEVGPLDLLAVDENGRLVVIEFKRKQTTRDTIAQILDYASALRLMSLEEIRALPNVSTSEMDDVVDSDPAMILVAAEADEAAERIVDYLASKAQLLIEVVTFTYAALAGGEEIIARSILTPDPPLAGSSKPTTKVTTEQLLQIADQSALLPLVQQLDALSALGLSVERFSTSGGKMRYWVKLSGDGGWRVLFGIYIGSEKHSTPEGSLDVWIRPETVMGLIGATAESVLEPLHQFEVVYQSQVSIVVRVHNEHEAVNLAELLRKWSTAAKPVPSATKAAVVADGTGVG
jgi:hypothetical protein